MQKRKLGNSTLDVTVVGLGGNNFGGRIDFVASQRVVHAAIDRGINLIDTADSYGNRGGSEEELGRILGTKRKEIVLASKFGLQMDDAGKLKGASRRYITRAVEASLTRLRTGWLDLYQLHRPDPQTPIEETLRALDDLVRQGKVRFIGCSNLSAQQLTEAQDTSQRLKLAAFVSCQDEYSLLVRDIEQEMLPAAKARGLGSPALLPARQRPAYRQVQARGADAAGLAAVENSAPCRRLHDRAQLADRRRARVLRSPARSQHGRAGVQLAVERRRGRERDRGRDLAGAGGAEHPRRGLGALDRGAGRNRPDHLIVSRPGKGASDQAKACRSNGATSREFVPSS